MSKVNQALGYPEKIKYKLLMKELNDLGILGKCIDDELEFLMSLSKSHGLKLQANYYLPDVYVMFLEFKLPSVDDEISRYVRGLEILSDIAKIEPYYCQAESNEHLRAIYRNYLFEQFKEMQCINICSGFNLDIPIYVSNYICKGYLSCLPVLSTCNGYVKAQVVCEEVKKNEYLIKQPEFSIEDILVYRDDFIDFINNYQITDEKNSTTETLSLKAETNYLRLIGLFAQALADTNIKYKKGGNYENINANSIAEKLVEYNSESLSGLSSETLRKKIIAGLNALKGS
jgi:hypothetical protein